MKLREALKQGIISLTDLEKKCLNAIRDEGSFFEEGGGNDSVRERGNAFFGWEIYESEVKGCRGAIASLVKKGVLDAEKDEDCMAYYINYELEFEDDDIWKIKFE